MPRRALGPASLVAVAVAVIWIISGVGAGDIAKFLGYEIAYVMLPGASLLWALRGREGFLLLVALGWPLGQTLEILAFSATAAIGLRGLFVAYPIVVVVGSALWIWRRSGRRDPQGPRGDEMSLRLMWVLAATLSLGLGYLCLAFLPTVPLPSLARSVSYYVDFPNFIGLIAEVRNHWPPTSPGLSGVPLHYQWFVFYHMAAINQVTNISIPIIAFRLDFVPTIVVMGCQLFVVGRFIGRSAWVGVLAVVVAFLLGPLDLTTDTSGPGASPFFDSFSFHLWASWTFPFGLTFFLGLLYLIAQRLQATTWRTSSDIRSWVLIGLLMIGASGSKATVLPVVVVGIGLYMLVVLVTERTVSPNAIVAFGLGVVIFGATLAIVYGGGIPGTVIQPLASLQYTVPVKVADNISSGHLRALALPFAYIAGLAGELLPFAGMLYLLRRRHRAQLSRYTLCLCMFGGGILIASLFHQTGGSSEVYFQDTGYAAGFIVAAAGLHLAWLDIRSMGANATKGRHRGLCGLDSNHPRDLRADVADPCTRRPRAPIRRHNCHISRLRHRRSAGDDNPIPAIARRACRRSDSTGCRSRADSTNPAFPYDWTGSHRSSYHHHATGPSKGARYHAGSAFGAPVVAEPYVSGYRVRGEQSLDRRRRN